MAGHLLPPAEDSQAIKDLVEIARRLSPEDQQDILYFARSRYRKKDNVNQE